MPVFVDATSIRFNGNSATKAFLNNNQIWPTIVNLITDGLLLQLDANNSTSYPGSGTTVFDLTNSYNHTLTLSLIHI